MPREAVRFLIRGRVQGVGYRWWATGQARRLGLSGWVRNLRTGEVELLAIGDGARIGQLETACLRGPSSAEVTAVDRSEAQDDGSQDFRERPTV